MYFRVAAAGDEEALAQHAVGLEYILLGHALALQKGLGAGESLLVVLLLIVHLHQVVVGHQAGLGVEVAVEESLSGSGVIAFGIEDISEVEVGGVAVLAVALEGGEDFGGTVGQTQFEAGVGQAVLQVGRQ